ncbi:hypothetical protein M3914_003280 [Vibrio metschnikovii]|nr:hypothetical protein [Vibrio metschnikovii]
MTDNPQKSILISFSSKPQLKNALNKLTDAEFEKIEKIITSTLESEKEKRAERRRQEEEKKLLIAQKLEELKNSGIQITDVKQYLSS